MAERYTQRLQKACLRDVGSTPTTGTKITQACVAERYTQHLERVWLRHEGSTPSTGTKVHALAM